MVINNHAVNKQDKLQWYHREVIIIRGIMAVDERDRWDMISKTNDAARAICKIISILQPYPMEYDLHVKKVNYKLL